MTIPSSLAAAVARRNVELDGRVYRWGEIVIPSAAVVGALTKETRADMADLAMVLRKLRAMPAAVSVEELRAVLPIDSGATSRDGAIADYVARQDNARQYLADLELARHEWARRKYK